MKKLLALLLVLALTLSACLVLTACGDGDEGDTTGDTTADGGQSGGGANNGGNNNGGQNGGGDNNGGQNGGASQGPVDAGEGRIGDGTYYHETRDDAWVIIEGTVLKSVFKFDASGAYALVYNYAINAEKNGITLTPVRAEAVSENPSAELTQKVEYLNSTMPTTTQNCSFAFVEDGVSIQGTKYYRTKPDYSQGGSGDQPVIIESLGAPQGTYSTDDGFRQDVILTEGYIYIVSGYSYGTLAVKYTYVYDAANGSFTMTLVEAMTPDADPSAEILEEVADVNLYDVGDTETYSFSVDGTTIYFDEYPFAYQSASITPATIPTSGGQGGGSSAGVAPAEGMYYSAISPNYRVKIEGKYLVLYRYFAEQTWVEIQYMHAFGDGVVNLEFIKADYAGACVDGVTEEVDEIYADYAANKYDVWSYSTCEGGFIIDGSTFLSEMPNYGGQGGGQGGGSSSGVPADGMYYHSTNSKFRVHFFGEYVTVYEHVVDDTWVSAAYTYEVRDGYLDLFFIEASFVGGYVLSVEAIMAIYESRGNCTMSFVLSGEGFVADGAFFTNEEPEYNGDGGDNGALENGTYYSTKYDDLYIIIDDYTITEVEMFDGYAIAYVFSYTVVGDVIYAAFVDVYLYEGTLTPELEETLEAARELHQGIFGEVEFSKSADGYTIDGNEYVATKPGAGDEPAEPLTLKNGFYSESLKVDPDIESGFIIYENFFITFYTDNVTQYALFHTYEIVDGYLMRTYYGTYTFDPIAYGTDEFIKIFRAEEMAFKKPDPARIWVTDDGIALYDESFLSTYRGEAPALPEYRFDNGIGGYFESELSLFTGEYADEDGNVIFDYDGYYGIKIYKTLGSAGYYEIYNYKIKDGVIYLFFEGAHYEDYTPELDELITEINANRAARYISSYSFEHVALGKYIIDGKRFEIVTEDGTLQPDEYIHPGRYYNYEFGFEYVIVADYISLSYHVMIDQYEGYIMKYSYKFVDSSTLRLTFEDVIPTVDDPSEYLLELILHMKQTYHGVVETLGFHYTENGIYIGGIEYSATPFDADGTDDSLVDGKYYSFSYEDSYIIIEDGNIIFALRTDKYEVGYLYTCAVDGKIVRIVLSDLVMLSGTLTPEEEEELIAEFNSAVGAVYYLVFEAVDDGYVINADYYTKDDPFADGGDEGETGDIADGKYYNSDYEDLYAIVEGNRITIVDVYDGFELGTVFEYFVDGFILDMTVVDVVVVSGTPDADALETVEQYRESMLGYNDRLFFEFIDDGFHFGGEDYTLTKPDYGEVGENIPNGLYCHDTYADEFMVEIYGEYYNEIIYFKDQGYVFTIYTYKLVDDVIELTFIDVDYAVENDSAKEFLESYAASRESTLSAMIPFTYRFEFVIDGFTLDGEATYLLQDVE